jgi:putative nucleotidyltransferase with HDIG domain
VRDFLLRRRPQDIDIATSALPGEVLRIFPRAHAIGAQFGVIQVRLYGHAYDVATFRTEGAYLDGRHPSSVAFSGPRQDAMRRDFTMNGLFFDPMTGRIIDYVHGAADIRRKMLRTIGKARDRFGEDKLRMLRAVRLACKLDFKIAPDTFDAIRRLAPSILEVSWERIRDELLRILSGPAPARGMDLMQETGLLAQILPEVAALRGVAQPAEFHPEGDVYEHTKIALSLAERPSPNLALGILLHDIGKPATAAFRERIRFDGHVEVGAVLAEAICRRLRLSNEDVERVVALVRNHQGFIHIRQMRAGTRKRFLRLPGFEDHLELHRVDCVSSGRSLDNYEFAKKQHELLQGEPPPAPRLLSGDDLIRMGYERGPVFRRILEAVEDLQLEDPHLTMDHALEFVRRTFPL